MSEISFSFVAERAAKLEREERFGEAHNTWLVAFDLANNYWNKLWCENRAHYCSSKLIGYSSAGKRNRKKPR